ncbi:DUF6779 domain-containing protein [Geodermatophilus sp. CPCC 206100]|uniref:DUF6779 domain-containing protein n=1 Tax=Geodermatophilus sp. CPCC 206100 TaxID=3020054 RepID=UPI003AFFA372
MRGDREGTSAGAAPSGSSTLRTAGLVLGFLLAVAATAVVFLSDDPQVLRLAVVGAAWAFVLAALAGSRRGSAAGGPGREAAEREEELRLAYELELEREVAARRETELRLANGVRHEAEQSVRAEVDALRGELARVAELRGDLAEVAGLRRDVAEVAGLRRDLAGLRRDLAGVAELRGDLAELRAGLAQLPELRSDLAQLAEVRADVGRLRAELTEQLSGEMLIERILLRTQATRPGPAPAESPAPRTIEAPGWGEPTGTAAFQVPAPPPPPPPPLDWLAERSLVEPEEPAEPRRRRTDDLHRPQTPAEQPTELRPVARRERPPVPSWFPEPTEDSAGGPSRLAEILAENGVSPSTGGRRRRRHRDDDEPDDVLSRVLGS